MPNWKNRVVRTGTADPKTLIPNPHNYREHGDLQRVSMTSLLDNLGWVTGVIINETTGNILDGHMRIEEAIKSGQSEVPVIWVNLLEEEERLFLATFDPMAYLANENKKRLNEIAANKMLQPYMSLEVLQNLAKRNKLNIEHGPGAGEEQNENGEGQGDGQQIDDEFSDMELGDMYQIINQSTKTAHRLICGDCREKYFLDRLLDDKKVNTVVTSPPYNQKINTFKPSGMQTESTSFVDRMANSYEDDIPEDQYEAQQVSMLDLLCEYIKPNGSIFYNHKIRYREKEILSPLIWLLKCKARVRQEIIWNRFSSITLNARMFTPADERIYWMRVGDDFVFNEEDEIKNWTNIWAIGGKNEFGTTAAFPIEIPNRCIRATTKMFDAVLDPYSGSGTTILSADKNGRIGYGIEISTRHMADSLRRMRDEGLRIVKV